MVSGRSWRLLLGWWIALIQVAAAEDWKPIIHQAPEGVEATAERIRRPAGLTVELIAAEPLLANPVAFCLDEQGRFFVAETFRHTDGATDNRAHLYWLKDELAAVTVEDRIRLFQRYLPPELLHRFRTYEDRVRLLWDDDGDGRLDRSTVFAGGFRQLEDGIGAGVLAWRQRLWFACIPHLWLLRDRDGDGHADVRTRLFSGFGVHVAFIGHDLHGLIIGPDGRLYFSIGDRGFNVVSPEGVRLYYPHTGAVLRCELDGSRLEVFHFGLRNPQELAFNQYGDLFTGDNNSDGGDKARIVQLVDGGNSGWTIGFQYAPAPVPRGMWNYEGLWQTQEENTALHILPPIAHLGSGPSGLVYHPGQAALPEAYQDSFFLCDFRGQIPISGIWRFRLEQHGAGYRMTEAEWFLENVCATDCTFGYDGAFYVLDWVEGWEKPGRGRIYRVFDPDRWGVEKFRRTVRLFREGFTTRSVGELLELLGHPDQRVRIEASIELARRGDAGHRALTKAAFEGQGLQRLHGIWGLGMQARWGDHRAAEHLSRLTRDEDPEVRAQAARALGESGHRDLAPALSHLILDSSPRVCFYATLAAARLRAVPLKSLVLRLAERNAATDPYLRHAVVMYLANTFGADALAELQNHRSEAVRVAAVLAMRRQRAAALRVYLKDRSPTVRTEAIRAIYDEPIEGALDDLAKVSFEGLPPWAQLRLLLALRRRPTPSSAERIVHVALNEQLEKDVRRFALTLLAEWSQEPWQDPVLGLYRPIPAGNAAEARRILLAQLHQLLSLRPHDLVQLAIQALVANEATQAGPALRALVRDDQLPAEVRAEALRGLGQLHIVEAQAEAVAALYADSPIVRSAAIEALAILAPDMAVEAVDRLIHSERATFSEKQAALLALAHIDSPEADRIVQRCMNRILRGEVPIELQVELLEVAAERAKRNPDIARLLQRYRRKSASLDPVERYAFALRGGDPEAGARVFYENAAVSCLRCHRINGLGGDVGPDLSQIGKTRDRLSLLRSIVDPDAELAEGYETVVLLLDDGRIVSGIVRHEDHEKIVLVTAEGNTLSVPKERVEERGRGPSAMPSDLAEKLTPRELRDLVEFLSRLGRDEDG